MKTIKSIPLRRSAAGVLLVCGLASLGGVAAQTAAKPKSDTVVASAGTVSVPQSDVERLLKSVNETELRAIKANPEVLGNWLRQRLASEALMREARSKGWADRPEVKAQIKTAVDEVTERIVTTRYLESLVQLPPGFPSDAEVEAAYTQGKAGFNIPATYRVAQIFLAAPSGDATALAKLREDAQKLAVEARTGDFASLARTRSNDARSAAQGGEVGQLPLAQLLPEIRQTVSELKPGEVSEPVPSGQGLHILKLLESQPARVATLQEMKPQLQAALRQQRQQQLVQAHMAGLVPAGSVSVNSAALEATLQKIQ